jgi:hypothetical protein
VTATELRRALPFLVIPLVLFLAGCGLLPWGLGGPGGPASSGPVVGDPSLPAHLAAWRAAGTTSYQWDVSFGCECMLSGPVRITVVDGKATEVRTPGRLVPLDDVTGFPLTIDDLYAKAQAAIDGGGTVSAEWGSIPGWQGAAAIPSKLLIDPIKDAIDDELSVSVLGFSPAP